MRIEFLTAANRDLQMIKEFHPNKGLQIVDDILKDIDRLASSPKLGASLSFKLKEETHYRYLVSTKFIVIYVIEKEVVAITRIFDARQDWLNQLFR
ncbi:type II toxin-antitoxin system RelE/ParE family toxin [Lactococcus nasutitermitis]|uniref:Type II toxin-antitoxin system RelE/ParE family toxin n=1 Tax=Lactococcus nasutitermitis TaxID=1652957 RepID=A0ABV9JEB2_9LACT|nr:type II toxin-antitoxin system RelE/ParE family toxin [Lactococcus nasutitermitis]